MPLKSKAQGDWWSVKRQAAAEELRQSRKGAGNPNWRGGGMDKKTYSRQYYQENKDKHRGYKWKQRGIRMTHDEYLALLNKQDGKCAVCQDSCQRGKLSVDHDHRTGKVRGLLCRKCNLILGMLEDDISRIQNMKEYLDAASQ